jgi:hypothetical protein
MTPESTIRAKLLTTQFRVGQRTERPSDDGIEQRPRQLVASDRDLLALVHF